MNDVISVRDKGLYVEIHGSDDAPALLYLHGGPGEGCYEFMLHQTHRLSKHLRLIAIDQRGVWRSDAVEEDEPLRLRDLVDDCEALRVHLGIERWSILGHSFGGILGLLYATTYPYSIGCAIFEGPSFDFVKSLHSMLKKAASIYESIGKPERARECSDLLTQNEDPDLLLGEFLRLAHGLGEELRMKIYTPGDGNNYSEHRYTPSEREEYARRSGIHLAKLRAEGRIYESLIPRFKELSMPTLLIKGKHDPVICEEQTLAFLNDVPKGDLIIYEEAGHLLHYEEPDRFAEDVINFIQRVLMQQPKSLKTGQRASLIGLKSAYLRTDVCIYIPRWPADTIQILGRNVMSKFDWSCRMKVLIMQPKLEKAIVQLERELEDSPQVDAVIFPEGYLNENVKEACTLAKKYGVVLIGGYRRLHEKPKDRAIMINRQGEIVIDRIKYSDTVFAIQDGLKIGHILCDEVIKQGLISQHIVGIDLIVHPIGVGMFSEEQFDEWIAEAKKIASQYGTMIIGTSHADGSFRDSDISIPIAYCIGNDGEEVFVSKNNVQSIVLDTERKSVVLAQSIR